MGIEKRLYEDLLITIILKKYICGSLMIYKHIPYTRQKVHKVQNQEKLPGVVKTKNYN